MFIQETVKNETYLGLRIYRFYIRCPKCLSEITFKVGVANPTFLLLITTEHLPHRIIMVTIS